MAVASPAFDVGERVGSFNSGLTRAPGKTVVPSKTRS
jgi:hypothetical protein